jgi:hypothetical protein
VFGLVRAAVAAVGARPDPAVPPGPDFFHYSAPDRLADLLGSAGLRDAEVTTVGFTQRLAGAEALWEGVMSGTVRISALVRGQDRAARARIRAEGGRTHPTFVEIGTNRPLYVVRRHINELPEGAPVMVLPEREEVRQ